MSDAQPSDNTPDSSEEEKTPTQTAQEVQAHIVEKVNYFAKPDSPEVVGLNQVKYFVNMILEKDARVVFETCFYTDVDALTGKINPVKKEVCRLEVRSADSKKNEYLGSFEMPDALNFLKAFIDVYHGSHDATRLYNTISGAWLDQLAGRRGDFSHHPKEKTPMEKVEMVFCQVKIRNGEAIEGAPWLQIHIYGIQDILGPKQARLYVNQHNWVLDFPHF